MIKIKFYAHMIFPDKPEISDMFRSIDIVTQTVDTVAKVFNGESTYFGNGSETVQYDDVVVFNELSDVHKEVILRNYPFARVISS